LILMILPGCVSRPTRRVSTVRWRTAQCLRTNRGQQIVLRSSRGGWTLVALR